MAFPEPLPEREAYILARIRAGEYEHEWIEISPGCEVSADALRIDGIRVNVSHRLQRVIADLLGAQLPTQILCDVRHTLASIVVPPMPMPINSTVAGMVEHSRRIDEAIGRKDTKGKIISTVGKTWLLHPSGGTRNYGMHSATPVFKGIKCEQSTIPGLYVIQGAWGAHDEEHVDYSQTCVLVKMGARGIVNSH